MTNPANICVKTPTTREDAPNYRGAAAFPASISTGIVHAATSPGNTEYSEKCEPLSKPPVRLSMMDNAEG